MSRSPFKRPDIAYKPKQGERIQVEQFNVPQGDDGSLIDRQEILDLLLILKEETSAVVNEIESSLSNLAITDKTGELNSISQSLLKSDRMPASISYKTYSLLSAYDKSSVIRDAFEDKAYSLWGNASLALIPSLAALYSEAERLISYIESLNKSDIDRLDEISSWIGTTRLFVSNAKKVATDEYSKAKAEALLYKDTATDIQKFSLMSIESMKNKLLNKVSTLIQSVSEDAYSHSYGEIPSSSVSKDGVIIPAIMAYQNELVSVSEQYLGTSIDNRLKSISESTEEILNTVVLMKTVQAVNHGIELIGGVNESAIDSIVITEPDTVFDTELGDHVKATVNIDDEVNSVSLEMIRASILGELESISAINPEDMLTNDDVLTKDNTTEFTPEGDYNPATKKYVDDSITASGGYTDEAAQDAVGSMLTDSTSIMLTYNDASSTITANAVFGTTGGSVAQGNHSHSELHSHTNKTTLDAITAAYTTEEQTKLSGIEANATADMSASDILAAIKTVDGSSSGLDADTLDGSHSSAFALSSHDHNTIYQPLDADLTSIAGLAGTTGILKKTAADTWTLDTTAYVTNDHDHVAADITDFDTEVDNNATVSANTAARHSHSNKTTLDEITAAYTTDEQTKLAGIAAGAEVNVQSDWNASSGDALILNKPTILTSSDVLLKTNTTSFTPTGDYNPATKKYVDDAITIAGGYNDESAQDAIGSILTDTSSINFTYNDDTPAITADVIFGTTAGTSSEGNHNHDSTYAAAANGVTNGNSHDHDGGDGAAIPPEGLKYYTTSGVGSGYVGQYTRLATVQLYNQYEEVEQVVEVVSGNFGGAHLRCCRINFKVKQQNAMGGAPVVDVVVSSYHGLKPADFIAVTTENTSSVTTVSLYWCPTVVYEYLTFRPLVYFDDSSATEYWYDNQGWSASLPSGTQTIGHDGMSHVYATRGSSQTIASATETAIIMSTEVTDTLGEYNAGTGVFTASEAGWYSVCARATINSTSWTAGHLQRTYLRINAANDYRTNKYAEATTSHYVGLEWNVPMVWLDAGDTLALYFYHTRGSDCALYADATANWMQIDRIN